MSFQPDDNWKQPTYAEKLKLQFELGRVLNAVREAAGLTLKELEIKSGIPATTINRWELAQQGPTLLETLLILNVTGFTFADFGVLMQKTNEQAFEMHQLLETKKRELKLLRAKLVLDAQQLKELESLAAKQPAELKP